MDNLVSLLATGQELPAGGNSTIIPSGVEEHGMRLFYVQLGFLILTAITISLRIICKVFVVKKTSLDDWLMYAAAAMYVPYGIIAMHGVTAGGTGKVVGTYTAEQASISLRAWYICEVMYSPITICIRISICLFILRIAVQKVHRWILIVNIGIISVLSVAYFFVLVFQCSAPSYFWKQVLGAKGSCVSPNVVPDATIIHSVISAISDWIVGLLPIAILWNVKINKRTKISIAFVLSMGIVAGVVILIRIPYLKRLEPSPNFLYETLDIAIWTLLEPAIGIFAGSLPSLRPLLKRWQFGIRSASQVSGSGSGRAPSNPSWRSPGTGNSSKTPRKNGPYYADTEGSETELTVTTNHSARPKSAWDVEHNAVSPAEPQPNAVYVETRINVSSHSMGVPVAPASAAGGGGQQYLR